MSNYFIRLRMADGEGILTVRPEHITGVISYGDHDVLLLTRGSYEIQPEQISFDCLVNHTQHAGVRVLVNN